MAGSVALLSTALLAGLTSVHASAQGIEANNMQELDGSIDFAGNKCDYPSAPPPTATSNGTVTSDCGADTAIPGSAPWDWSSIFDSTSTTSNGPKASWAASPPAGFLDGVFLPYAGDLFTQGSKDTLPISGWTCTKQSTPPKDQLVNAYATAWNAPSTNGTVTSGDSTIFAGLERPNTNGDSNAGYWLFQHVVVCNPATGAFVDQNGNAASHSNNDVFLVGSFTSGGAGALINAYTWTCNQVSTTDTTCASNSPGSLTGPVDLTFVGSGPCGTTAGVDACEAVNQKAATIGNKTYFNNWTVLTPWTNIDTGSAGIPGPGFLEMGIDLTSFFKHINPGATTPCFASFLTDTRSSGSSTQASTKNFINGQFATCGTLQVHKYIDQNLNGAFDSGTDLSALANVAPTTTGWPVTVKDSLNNTVCSGTTDTTTGNLSCTTGTLANLPPGTYTVTETQKAGFYNTDPGTGSTCTDTASGSATPPDSTDVNQSNTTVSCTVTMGVGTTTVQIGNQCSVTLTFKVTGIPAGTTGVKASWGVSQGFDSGVSSAGFSSGSKAQSDVTLSPIAAGSTTYQGSATFPFIQNDKVSWNFYVNGDSANQETGATNVDLSGSIYSATTGVAGCAKTSTGAFAPGSILALKYKDKDASGLVNGAVDADDTLANGFTFKLIALTSSSSISGSALTTALGVTCTANTVPSSPCVYDTQLSKTISSQDGQISFTSVNPGYYQIHEVVPTGWKQTAPTGTPADYVVQVVLSNTTVTADTGSHNLIFLDTPTYDFGVTFSSDANLPGGSTAASKGTIACSPDAGSASGNGTGSASYSATGVTGVNSKVYTCTITVTDP